MASVIATDINSNQSSAADSKGALESCFKFCIVGELKDDIQLLKAIKTFNLPVVFSEDGSEFSHRFLETCYILKDFEGEVYTTLHEGRHMILGPTIVMQSAGKNEEIPAQFSPLFNAAMQNLVITFNGFRVKEELRLMVNRIRHMGGKVRADMKEITHLIAFENLASSKRYRYASRLGIPIMSETWVHEVWNRRYDPRCSATDEEFMKYKLEASKKVKKNRCFKWF